MLNHFAHALVASARAADPLLALGAMLPDFAGFLRERIAELDHPALREGCACTTPATPPSTPRPSSWPARGRRGAAARAGPRARTGARAPRTSASSCCSTWRWRASRRGGALRALRWRKRRGPEIDAAIAWRRAEAAPRWRALHARLAARGAPDPSTDAVQIAQGVARTLAPRPRLALAARELDAVARWLADARAAVEAAAPRLLAQVLAATSAPGASNGASSSAGSVCVSGASKPSRP